MRNPSSNPDMARTIKEPVRRALATVMFFSFVINILVLTSPLYMMQVYDRVLTSASGHTLLLLTALAVGLLSIAAFLEFVRQRLLVRLGTRLDVGLSGALFGRVISASDSGGARMQPLTDLETLRAFISGNGLIALIDMPWAPIFLGIVFVVHPTLGLIALIGAAVLFTVALIGELATRNRLRGAGGHAAAATGFCEGALRNSDVIDALGMAPALTARWQTHHHQSLAAQARAADLTAGFLAVAKFVRPTLQVAMLACGAYLAIQQIISPGVMIAASILMVRSLAPVEMAIANWRYVVLARAAYRRLVSDTRTSKPDRARDLIFPRPTGRLTAESVFAAPPGHSRPIIKNVGFDLAPGESLGIIGPSGAGKSTLARLLIGVYQPMAGIMRLDGADIRRWDGATLGRYLGYLPQDVELFDGTVAENISRFQDATSEEILTAAERAGAHDMILGLADGYDTSVGIGGSALSGGERQRIGLARALFGDPALVVLDEPNANLDPRGEHALSDALADLKARGTTTIVIAHRPSILRSVDKLLVLRGGEVDLFGARDDVLPRLTRPVTRSTTPIRPPVPATGHTPVKEAQR
jgi:PrtD family type I secretion system ABC transporter